jgi:hypothetical protein
VCIDGFAFYHKDDVSKLGIVDDLAHVHDQVVNCFVIYFVLFQLANVQYADVVQPLASIKSTEYEQLLSAYNTCSVSLSTSRSLLTLNWVTPSHRVSIQYIQVVRGNYFLEGSTSAIVATKQVDLIAY